MKASQIIKRQIDKAAVKATFICPMCLKGYDPDACIITEDEAESVTVVTNLPAIDRRQKPRHGMKTVARIVSILYQPCGCWHKIDRKTGKAVEEISTVPELERQRLKLLKRAGKKS